MDQVLSCNGPPASRSLAMATKGLIQTPQNLTAKCSKQLSPTSPQLCCSARSVFTLLPEWPATSSVSICQSTRRLHGRVEHVAVKKRHVHSDFSHSPLRGDDWPSLVIIQRNWTQSRTGLTTLPFVLDSGRRGYEGGIRCQHTYSYWTDICWLGDMGQCIATRR